MSGILHAVDVAWGPLDKANPLSHMLKLADEHGLLNELLDRCSEIRKADPDMDSVSVCAQALFNLSY